MATRIRLMETNSTLSTALSCLKATCGLQHVLVKKAFFAYQRAIHLLICLFMFVGIQFHHPRLDIRLCPLSAAPLSVRVDNGSEHLHHVLSGCCALHWTGPALPDQGHVPVHPSLPVPPGPDHDSVGAGRCPCHTKPCIFQENRW